MEYVADYLGCTINCVLKNKMIMLLQLNLIKNTEEQFTNYMKKIKSTVLESGT